MPDITVEPASLQAAAARLEQTGAAVDAVARRLADAGLLGPAVGLPTAATALLRRSHADLQADQPGALGMLADALGEDAGRLRQAAGRYLEADCQSRIGLW